MPHTIRQGNFGTTVEAKLRNDAARPAHGKRHGTAGCDVTTQRAIHRERRRRTRRGIPGSLDKSFTLLANDYASTVIRAALAQRGAAGEQTRKELSSRIRKLRVNGFRDPNRPHRRSPQPPPPWLPGDPHPVVRRVHPDGGVFLAHLARAKRLDHRLEFLAHPRHRRLRDPSSPSALTGSSTFRVDTPWRYRGTHHPITVQAACRFPRPLSDKHAQPARRVRGLSMAGDGKRDRES